MKNLLTVLIGVFIMANTQVYSIDINLSKKHRLFTFKLQGKIISNKRARIQVFELNEPNETWISIYKKENIRKYSFLLNPVKTYQIWFANDQSTKIITIEKGKEGNWYKYLDVVLLNTQETIYGLMYQKDDEYMVKQIDCGYFTVTLSSLSYK